MKNRLHQLLMLFVVSIVSLSSWADRVAPTLPEGVTPQTLESGKEYYLLNVGSGFLGISKENTSLCGIASTPRKVVITQESDGYCSIKYSDTGYYADYYNQSIGKNGYSYYNVSECSWQFTVDGGNYKISASPKNNRYAEGNYWGTDNNSDIIYYNKTEGNLNWQLFDANGEVGHYVAEYDLYTALNYFDGFPDINSSFISYYDGIYADRANKTIEELENAANAVRRGTKMSAGYIAPYWNEYPILWSTPDGIFGNSYYDTWALTNNSYTSGTYFKRMWAGPGSSTLCATVNVDQLSTLIYSTDGSGDDRQNIKVYIDDNLVRTLIGKQITTFPTSKFDARFTEILQPGVHTIKWVATSTKEWDGYYNNFDIEYVGIVKSPLITVSLLEPGSLGTEVLYNTDHIKNVRRLKVKGEMNDDDFAKIKMMSGLLDLDLSEAKFTEIPEREFEVQDNDTVLQFLHRLVLPEGLKKINGYAFQNSFIDTLALPSTLQTIGIRAFNGSHMQEIDMPDNCIDVFGAELWTGYENRSGRVFRDMKWLKKLKCARNWEMIPYDTYTGCNYLEEVTLPKEIKTLGESAFFDCWSIDKIEFPEGLQKINLNAFYNCETAKFGSLPESLELIGKNAFFDCDGLIEVVIPKNVTTIGTYAFDDCSNLTSATLSTHQYAIADNMFEDCTSLKTLRLNSPTVATVTETSGDYPVDADKLKNVDLIVPSFLVNNYKLDKYWYNFKSISGFSTAEIQDWTINNPLVLNHDRFDGTPNITISGDYSRTPSLKINGTNAQVFKNLTIDGSYNTSSVSGKETSVICKNNYPGQIYSNDESNNIQITGDAQVNLWAPSKTWEFFSLPFDCKIADITFGADAVQYAIRYYDGANRATVGATGSWKNYDKDNDVIPAGTGFIIQTNKDTWCYFKAVDNDMKQNMVSYKEFSKTLEVNDCETASNKGWNLIGNPYQCFYNDHSLNFTAPITVWNNYNKNYVAYSLTDDDYAIRPNEAFFVQCPNAEYSTITFPLQGRQLNDVIESQNAAKVGSGFTVQGSGLRKLVNLTLSNGEQTDQTRIVLNEKASLSYETSCDASKFMSMDNSVPQLYTVGADGTQYAINERPEADGKVALAYVAAKEGTYTIAVTRSDAQQVYLIDNETSTTTDITNSEYTFSTEAGANAARFVIAFNAGETTGISSVNNEQLTVNNGACYNLAGQRVENAGKGIFITNGKKVIK